MKPYLRLALMMGATCISATPAFASGFQIREHSAGAMGAAYAGASASGSDANFLAYNPASSALVKDWDFGISATEILPSSNANYTTALTSAGNPTGGLAAPKDFITSALIPDVGFRVRLSDRLAAGFSISTPWGLRTNYQSGWAGRYYGLKTALMVADFAPSLSYQVLPGVAVAAALDLQYAKGSLSSAVDFGTLGALYAIPGSIPGHNDGAAILAGQDWGVGYTLGVLAHVTPTIVAGLSYHSAVPHSLKGLERFTFDSGGVGAILHGATGLFTDGSARASGLTMPDTLSFGVNGKVCDDWTGLFELAWTNWSRFHAARVISSNPLQPDDITTSNWHSSIFASVGAEYRADEHWSVRAGTAYDQSPIPDSTRGPRIPDSDRIWLSAGGTYRANDTTDVKFSYAHLFTVSKTVALTPALAGNALRGTLLGNTESAVDVIGLQLVYRGSY